MSEAVRDGSADPGPSSAVSIPDKQRNRNMTRNSRTQQKPERDKPDDESKSRDHRSQGIVRDQRGQEQPADKERAQRVSKSESG